MQYLAKRDSASPKVLAFRTPMGTPEPNLSEPNLPGPSPVPNPPVPSPPVPQGAGVDPQRHGNLAQRRSAYIAGGALFLVLINTVLMLYFHYSEGQSKALDDHLKVLIGEELERKLEPLIKSLHDLENRVSKIEGQLSRMSSNVPFNQALQEPVQYASAIKDKVTDALKAGKTSLNPKNVQRAGGTLLDGAPGEGEIWSAAQACLDYVSFWNSQLALPPARGKSKYQVNVKRDPSDLLRPSTYKVLYAGNPTPINKSALLASVDNPHPRGSGFSNLIVDGNKNTIILDSMQMRHVILRNADLQYNGGSVRLEDVSFVNCTFNSGFTYGGNSVELGHKILKAVALRDRRTRKTKLSDASISYSAHKIKEK